MTVEHWSYFPLQGSRNSTEKQRTVRPKKQDKEWSGLLTSREESGSVVSVRSELIRPINRPYHCVGELAQGALGKIHLSMV